MADSKPTDRIAANWSGARVETVPVGELSEGERVLWRMLADEADGFVEAEAAAAEDAAAAVDDDPLF